MILLSRGGGGGPVPKVWSRDTASRSKGSVAHSKLAPLLVDRDSAKEGARGEGKRRSKQHLEMFGTE